MSSVNKCLKKKTYLFVSPYTDVDVAMKPWNKKIICMHAVVLSGCGYQSFISDSHKCGWLCHHPQRRFLSPWGCISHSKPAHTHLNMNKHASSCSWETKTHWSAYKPPINGHLTPVWDGFFIFISFRQPNLKSVLL